MAFPLFKTTTKTGGDPKIPDGNNNSQIESVKSVAKALRRAGPAAAPSPSWQVMCYPVSKGLSRSTESATTRSVGRAAKELTKQMPLRRFVAFPEIKAKAGSIVVCEGVLRTAKIIATVGYFGQSDTNRIADYDMYFILSCLPFAVRASMF